MCGIVGLVSNHSESERLFSRVKDGVSALHHRGPDRSTTMLEPPFALGHARLAIIDLDPRSDQPMTDTAGRYTLVFNGEIYNYQQLRQECSEAGFNFKTEGDTEVLLVMYMRMGQKCLERLNGCFAFAIYDRSDRTIFMARDRMGIKPLVYYKDQHTLAFASELAGLAPFGFQKEIDKVALFNYFKFNYVPAPDTMLEHHHKLPPGHWLKASIDKEGMITTEVNQWYQVPYDPEEEKKLNSLDYQNSKAILKRFVRESVQRRLVADVPIGTFLSGGVDSSIITAMAKAEKEDITAFSVGFPDQPNYDETNVAKVVAKHLKVRHEVIAVRSDELMTSAEQMLDHFDEPFADSSALNVNLLSERVSRDITVALSGDGGDELFAGYQKHMAEFKLRFPTLLEHAVGNMQSVWDALPASRDGFFANQVRKAQKFSQGYHMSRKDRYWRWAGVMTEEEANYLLKEQMLPKAQRLSDDAHRYKKLKDHYLKPISKDGTLNEILLADVGMVLPNDMLFKVDHASMKNSLEVRTPLLDQHIVKFAFRLPHMFKINHNESKKILKEAFSEELPPEVFNHPKHGFEVPLLSWFRGPLKERFQALVTDEEMLLNQGLFNPTAVAELHQKLYSNNPGDSPRWAWAMLVFQSWYQRNF